MAQGWSIGFCPEVVKSPAPDTSPLVLRPGSIPRPSSIRLFRSGSGTRRSVAERDGQPIASGACPVATPGGEPYPARVTRFLCTHVEVYVFRRRGRRVEFLALRRAPTRRHLPGIWQPVTGKRTGRETPIGAALREVREETGLVPRRWWALESPTLYYDPAEDAMRVLPLFAAEVGARETVEISEEHDRWRFLSPAGAAARFLWQAQRAAVATVRREVLGRSTIRAALDITELTPPNSRAPSSTRRSKRP